jgi:hypothetical protein
MNTDFISTVPKITATLLGFTIAIFVFWFRYRYGNSNKKLNRNEKPLFNLFVISFVFVIISGVFLIIYSMNTLYFIMVDKIGTEISNNYYFQASTILFWIFTFSMFGFFMLMVYDIWTRKMIS